MNHATLPRAHAPGWAHPYPVGPFSPLLYADGGGEGDGDQGAGDDADDTGEGPDSGGGEDAPGDGDDEPDPEGSDQLGDRGKRALATMKGKWRAERERRKELEEKLAQAQGRDGEGGDTARKAEAEALSKANARILKAEIKAAAKGKLADPSDAFRYLDLDQFEVDEDGEVDEEEIAEAIEELLKTKPYLAAQGRPRFQGTGDGGAARKASRPKQLTREDVKRMSPQEIMQAKAEGRLSDLLGTN